MYFPDWISDNYIEIFGAAAGILYVFLEIRQNIWLWPVGIITSAVYIWVFFTGKLYADMSLQGYYLVISILGWYWWIKGIRRRAPAYAKASAGKAGRRAQESGQSVENRERETQSGGRGTQVIDHGMCSNNTTLEGGPGGITTERISNEITSSLKVSRLKLRTGIFLGVIFVLLYSAMWLILDKLTDSPVPEWDSFITSLSIIATWMLARKIFEHWFLWIVVNLAASGLFFFRGLYPTVILYIVYCAMSFVGLHEWKKSLKYN